MSDIKVGKIYKRKYVRGKEYYFVTRIKKERNIASVDIMIFCYRMDNPDNELFFYEENIKSLWSEIKNVGQIRD